MITRIIMYPPKNKFESLKFLFYKNVPRLFFLLAIFILIYTYLITEYASLMSPLSVIFTPILTLIFLLTVESWNDMKKEKTYLQAIVDEAVHNLANLKSNLDRLYDEQESLKEGKMKLYPLHCINLDVWDAFNQNISIKSSPITFIQFNTFVFDSRRYNDFIQRKNLIPIFAGFEEAREILNKPLVYYNNKLLKVLFNILKSFGNMITISLDDIKDFEALVEVLNHGGVNDEFVLGNCKVFFENQSEEPSEIIIFNYGNYVVMEN